MRAVGAGDQGLTGPYAARPAALTRSTAAAHTLLSAKIGHPVGMHPQPLRLIDTLFLSPALSCPTLGPLALREKLGRGAISVSPRFHGPADRWETWEKRAAIMAADGGLPRPEAER